MPELLALLPQLLALLPTITVGVEHLFAWIVSIRAAAQQSGEWTADMETAFVNSLIARATKSWYQPDPIPAV